MSADTDYSSAAATTPPKYSRYRSVRHTLQPEPAVITEQTSRDDLSRTKSMSRYRKSRVVSKDQLGAPPAPQPPMPALPVMPRTSTIATRNHNAQALAPQPPILRNSMRRGVDPVSAAQSSPRQNGNPAQQVQSRSRETEDERLRRKVREFQDREKFKAMQEEQLRLQSLRTSPAGQARVDHAPKGMGPRQPSPDSRQRPRNPTAALVAEAVTTQRSIQTAKPQVEIEAQRLRRTEEENLRLLEAQKKKDLERLQKELDAAVPNPPLPKPQLLQSPLREKFSFFSRKKDGAKDPPPETPKSSSGPAPATLMDGNGPPRMNAKPKTAESKKLDPNVDAPKKDTSNEAENSLQIGQGGGGIVPQIDAPISASNAGERRVLIRCKQSSINLPVTPDTTPSDIIYSAANIMTQNIIPSTALLIESYTQLGLERRVRRYEHVRDVMNSWDRDTQNFFLLQNSDSPNFDTDLEVSSVGREPPADVTVYMYHSQKPGKWNKRYITLLSSGQIYMSKRSGTKHSEKDVVNLCHLSDFDIYTPTPQQTRKVLKPPKKNCYAIKSQQKTTMFLSTENFVHFFSCEEPDLANKWYSAVQTWRSWYLVNRMGEGRKKAAKKAEDRSGSGSGHTLTVEENPYTIGSFTPLFDDRSFGSGSDDENQPRQIPFHLRNSIFFPEQSKRDSRRHPPIVSYRVPDDESEEFASTGLLGRTYSQRQRDRDGPRRSASFMDGRTLSMSSAKTKRPSTSGDGILRNSSQRKPKPLLDFTPQFKEAPQWDKTGKGRGVAAVTGMPLVETATTPWSGLDDIPKSTVFRRETLAARPATSAARTASGENRGFVSSGLLSKLNNPKGNGVSMLNRGRVVYD